MKVNETDFNGEHFILEMKVKLWYFFKVYIYRKGSEGRGEIEEVNASEFPDAALRKDEE